jgi:hypothetical protein
MYSLMRILEIIVAFVLTIGLAWSIIIYQRQQGKGTNDSPVHSKVKSNPVIFNPVILTYIIFAVIALSIIAVLSLFY